MKISVNSEKLKEMMMKSIRGASRRSEAPLTNMINISCKDNKLTLLTTDMTNYLYVTEDVECDDFYITVMADDFNKIVSKITSEFTTLEVKENMLEIVGNGKYSLEIPLNEDGNHIIFNNPYDATLSSKKGEKILLSDVKTILKSIKPSLAVTEEIPSLLSYCITDSVLASNQTLIGAYAKRLLKKDVLISVELMNLLDVFTDESIKVVRNKECAVFITNSCMIYSVYLEDAEDYPAEAITNLVASEFPSNCKIHRNKFMELLDRMSLFVGVYDNNFVNMEFTDADLTVVNIKGNSKESIDYIIGDVAKKYNCMIDINKLFIQVKTCDSDVIELQFGAETEALKIIDGDVTKIIALSE